MGALAAFFVIGMFGMLFKLPSWVIDLSPFQHVPAIPAQDFSAQPLIILTLIAAALVSIGLIGFRRRDVS